MILVKFFLESNHVYWMALSKSPKFVINKLGHKMSSILWAGKKEKGVHLVRWESLSLPKSFVGRGVINGFGRQQVLISSGMDGAFPSHPPEFNSPKT